MPYRLVVFDFDGTVADTSAAICEVANRTLERFGFARMPDTRIRQTLGLELPVIFEQLTEGVADAAKLDAMARAYRDGFDPVGLSGARLFDGVRPALERLRARGTRTGIATMRGMLSLASLIEALDAGNLFDHLVSGTCVVRGKPDPEMLVRHMEHFGVTARDVLMVGDTVYDVRMGRAVGSDTCAVAYGAHGADRLRAEEPTYLVESSEALGALL